MTFSQCNFRKSLAPPCMVPINCRSWPKVSVQLIGRITVATAQRFQMTKTRQKKLPTVNQVSANSLDFRFRSLQVLYFQNVSKCCSHTYNQSISRVFWFNFWRVFVIWNLCVPPRPRSLHQRFITISLVGVPKLKVKTIFCMYTIISCQAKGQLISKGLGSTIWG